MSIADELNKNIADLAASYVKTADAGATQPTQKNFDNLPATIASIDSAVASGIPPLSMNSVSDYPARDYKVYGDSFQQTYSGKNLLNGAESSSSNQATATMSDDIITISSTSTVTTPYCGWSFDVSTNDIIRVNLVILESTGQVVIQGYNGTSWFFLASRSYTDGVTITSAVYANEIFEKIRVLLYADSAIPTGASSSSYKNVIVTINNSDMTYEPYTGGIPAPNPDYPQGIESVGDLITEGENAGKYSIPITVSDGTNSETTNIILDEPLRKIGDYADYIDFKNQSVVRNIAEIASYNGETISGSYMSTTGSLTTGATVDYSLTSPTTTSVSLPSLERFAGEVTVTVGTSIQPSNMWVKF